VPRRNGDEDIVLWRLVKVVGNLEKKMDSLINKYDKFAQAARNQRTWLVKLRADLARQRAYTKELETVLKLQREDEDI